MSARYVGVDYGTKRIGLSVSDPTGSIASPFKTVEGCGACGAQVRDVVDAVAEFDVDEWVVGLPLNMDGSKGPQAVLTEEFASRLADAVDAPVHLWDERMSTLGADAQMAGSGLTHKKKKRRRDALAAQVILAGFLDSRAGGEQ